MNNISNSLFEFTDALVTAANETSAEVSGGIVGHLGEPVENPLTGVLIHAEVYEEIKPGKTIRIDDVRQATPVQTAGGGVRKDNAIISVQFIVMPASQKLSDRLAARQLSEDLADAWLAALFANPKLVLSDGIARFCTPVGQVSQFNEWIKPGTVKMPVCVLRLQINPRR